MIYIVFYKVSDCDLCGFLSILSICGVFSMQLKAKHSNSDNHQTMIHMTNHRPLHNNIYHYVSHHTMIAIHISVTVNMVSWGICMHVEIDLIY